MGSAGQSTINQRTIKARFVGGPLHNRILHVYLVTDIACGTQVEHYHLYRFTSEYGAKFCQYVHESLISADGSICHLAYIEPAAPTLPERLVRQFQKRMAGLYRHRRLTFDRRAP